MCASLCANCIIFDGIVEGGGAKEKSPTTIRFSLIRQLMNYHRDRTDNGKNLRVAEMLLGCLFTSAHSISFIYLATMVAEIQRRNSE